MKNNTIIINYFLNHHNNDRKSLYIIKSNSLIAIIRKLDRVQIEKEYIMLGYDLNCIFVDSDAKVQIR